MASWTAPNEFILNIDVNQDGAPTTNNELIQHLYRELTSGPRHVALDDGDDLVFRFSTLPDRFAAFGGLRQGTLTLYFSSRYSDNTIRTCLTSILGALTAQVDHGTYGNISMKHLTQRLLR